MAKVKGSYKSLVRGVSEQVPHDRLEGQHYEQINMVSDPIRGLVRRRGSTFLSRIPSTGTETGLLSGFREHSFTALGKDYAVMYSKRPIASGIEPAFVFDKDTNKLLTSRWSTAAMAKARNGITSAVSVGRYLLLSNPDTPVITATDQVNDPDSDASVWIRGGAYSRTYTLTYGSSSVSYTTPKSYYDGTLNTSDIPYDATDYQKQVNDRVHAYNTAVNQYIASAQEAISPANIATQLTARLNAAGIGAGSTGPHIHVYGLADYGSRLTGSDGGDGSFMRVTHKAVSSLDDLTKYHNAYVTVAVEVTSDDVYYVRAHPKHENAASYQEVTWREWTGETLDSTFPFLIGTIYNGEFWVAESASELEAHLPSGHGLDVPDLVGRRAGDDNTNPRPDFFSRPISHMTVFQDRLVICSGANVFMSVPGDYFNWFRKSALRVDPDDPIEVYALGAEDDVIRGSTTIDRNLILLGDSLHYAISGRDVITPTNAIVSVQAAHESTTDAAPQALGNLLFYSQYQGGLTKLHQMQVGAFADSFDNFSVTQQITKYIDGRPRQLVTSSQPNMVLMSTEFNPYGVYVFTFLDSPGQTERLFDSWSRWQWDESLGPIIGMTNSDTGFIIFTLRSTPEGTRIVADEFSRDSGRDDLPYLDSKIRGDLIVDASLPTDYSVALPTTHPRRYFGRTNDRLQELIDLPDVSLSDLWAGRQFVSAFEPTSPYLRDDNDNAILSGRTVLTQLGFSLVESAGIEVVMQARGETGFTHRVLDDAGFRIADPLSPLGAVPLTDRRVTCYIGREIREHRLRVLAKGWTPLNIATIEWTLQTFNRR